MPDRNADPHKGMMNTGYGDFMDKYVILKVNLSLKEIVNYLNKKNTILLGL